MTQCVIEYLKD